jgi:hypothetical protein
MKALQRADKVEAGANGNAAQGKKSSAITAGDSDYRRANDRAGIPERAAQRGQAVVDASYHRRPCRATTRG